MNRKYIVSIGVVVSMLSSIASADFVNDGFEGVGLGGSVNGGQWRADTSVVVSNKAKPNAVGQLTQAAMIPILKVLTNDVALAATEKKVWTDFWTIPRPFVSAVDAAPAVDPNSSAMFFVTNTRWAVVCGAGGSTTNVYTTDVFGDSVRNVVNDGSTWYQVSVFHNYGATNWSFFVDGKPVMTNMSFISNVPNYQWFSVQNGGGNVSNVTWIDDVLITNRVPSSLTNDHQGDGVLDAWELMYYGTIGVVSPTNDADGDGFDNSQESILGGNPAVKSADEPGGSNAMEFIFGAEAPGIASLDITNATAPDMKLTFTVGSNRMCKVLRATSPNGPFSEVPALAFSTGSGGTPSVVDVGALNQPRYYYKVVAVDPQFGFVETNDQVYVFHKQFRGGATCVSNYWVGVTVNYGAESKLGSTLGRQLARGLSYGSSELNSDILTVYYPGKTDFRLNEFGQWVKFGNGSADTNTTIPVGVAVFIQKRALGSPLSAASSAVFAGPVLPSSGASVPVNPGWNMISSPYEGSNTIASVTCGAPSDVPATADKIWVYRDGQYRQLRRWTTYGWQFEPKTTQNPTNTTWGYIQLGEGVFYWNSASASSWTP